MSSIGLGASTDLGLGLQQQTQEEIMKARKKREQMLRDQNASGAMGQPGAAYQSLMSMNGNQF
jgi:hypothetical protein